jgi:hypothetical protein
MSSYSKGSRGLSVLLRVAGIFTGITISPSPSLRQRPSRYAIRAGRNFTLFPCYQGCRLYLHPAIPAVKGCCGGWRMMAVIDLPGRH